MVVPQGLEQHIPEADRHQVLHCLFAEIMVDPVDLFLVEMQCQRCVQRLRRRQIAPERFFDNDTALGVCDPVFMQALCQIAKERRRDREIERADNAIAHQRRKIIPAGLAFGIDCNIAQTFKETFDRGRIFGLAPAEFGDRLGDERPEAGIIQLAPRRADDPRGLGHLPAEEPTEQARQDLAPGKIAGAAENYEVEIIDRDDTRNHFSLRRHWHL